MVNNADDGIYPEDSISNVASKHSRKSVGSSKASTSSSRVKAEAEKAALLVRIAALKSKHALEEQEHQIRRQKEQQDLETMLAESDAKLAVLQAFDSQGRAKASNAMNSYLEKEMTKSAPTHRLDPMAKEFICPPQTELQQASEWSVPIKTRIPVDVTHVRIDEQPGTRPKEWTGSNRQSHQPALEMEQQSFQVNTSYLNQTGGLLSMIHRQNEMTSSLIQQQRSSSLPARDIPLYDGDPLQYLSFMRAFEQGVE